MKALVALPDQARDTVDRGLRRKLGTGRSDIVGAIIRARAEEWEQKIQKNLKA